MSANIVVGSSTAQDCRSSPVDQFLACLTDIGQSPNSVNCKLAAVSAFYAHQARNGAEVGDLLAVWKAGGRDGVAVPTPCQQGQAVSRPGHLAESPAEAEADP